MIGELIAGRYRLVDRIAEGVTSIVYRAVEEGGETVAVKLLRPELAPSGLSDNQAARRFEREAVAAGKLAHDNLVGVRDFGALEDGRPYLVMDLIEGRSLAELVAAEGRLSPARAMAILAHVLRGLDHAHQAGVVHRDLEPRDILLVERAGDRDFAVIVDFGAAALVGAAGASAEQLTRAGDLLGAAAYMAPERLDPEPGDIDGRADLYSATCILFEMVSGRPPFGAASGADAAQVLARHRGADRPRLADVVPEVESTAALDAIVARGLARDPRQRFASAADYLDAVEAFLRGRLDPTAVGKPPQPAGRLAEPDPNKATTVFHGAPPPTMPPTMPPPSMSPAPAAQPSWRGGRWKVIPLACSAAALLAFAFLVGRAGDTAQEKPEDPLADLVEAWRRAGLEPSPFAVVTHAALADGDCRRGAVSGVDVIVCRFATAERAQEARKGSLRVTKGQGAASAHVSGQRLLVAQSRQRRDPKRALSRVMRAFRDAGEKANKVDRQQVRTERSE